MVYENDPKARMLNAELNSTDPRAKIAAANLLHNEIVNNPAEAMNLIRMAQQHSTREQVIVARDGSVVLQDAYSNSRPLVVGRLPLSNQIPITGGYRDSEQLAAMTNRANLGGGQQYESQQYRTITNPTAAYTNPNAAYNGRVEQYQNSNLTNPNLTNPNLAYENTTGANGAQNQYRRQQRQQYQTGNSNIGNSNIGNSNIGNTNLGNNANNIGEKNLGNNYLNTQNTNQGNNALNVTQYRDGQGHTYNYNRNNNQNSGGYNNERGYGNDRDRGINPALAFGIGVGVAALDASLYQNRYNNGYLNNGYDNGYLNNGYDNGYNNGNNWDNANPIVQRLAFDLQNGNQDDAANLIRRELNFNPRQALAEMHQANLLAGPDAPDRIRRLNDGTVVVTDSYSQTQEFAGQLPSPVANLYNQQRNDYNRQPIYDNGNYDGLNNGVNRQPIYDNGNYDGLNNGVSRQPIYDNGNYDGLNNGVNRQPIYDNGNYDGLNNGVNRQPIYDNGNYDGLNNGVNRQPIYDNGNYDGLNTGNLQYQQNYMQHARTLAFDLRSGRQDDAAYMLRNDLRINPLQALNEIRMANQMAGIDSPERIETSRNGEVVIRDRYTGRSEFVGRLPGAPIGNYYNGANNGYYRGVNNGYYNGNNSGYNGGITSGEYLGGAAITGVTAGLTAGLISGALRRGGRH